MNSYEKRMFMNPSLTLKDQCEIEKAIAQAKEQLLNSEVSSNPETIDSMLSAMQIGMEIAKKRNKEKYTPKKYKKMDSVESEVSIEALLTSKDKRDISRRLDATLSDLESSHFHDTALDEETMELLKTSLKNSITVAKIEVKQKYTPKKYRK